MAKSKQFPAVNGVYAAIATPRRPDSIEADAAALLEYLDTIVRAGVDGLVLFGSTGEFVHFDSAERMRVLTLAIRRSRVPVLVNVSHSTLAGAIELGQNAVESGAAGVLLMPPYFYRYTDDQLFAFYREFLRGIDGKTRVYLYNLPFYTNPMEPALLERLLGSGEFAGIKDSSGEPRLLEALTEIRKRVPFTLMAGSPAGRRGQHRVGNCSGHTGTADCDGPRDSNAGTGTRAAPELASARIRGLDRQISSFHRD